jgi:type I restriction enzyme, S subunit
MNSVMAPLSKFAEINPESINSAYSHDEIQYTDISSVGAGYLMEPPKTLSLKEAPSRAKRIVRHGDTILATVRPNLRSFLFIKSPEDNAVVSTGFAVLRAKEKSEPRYIYYAITDNRFTQYLTNNTKGTSYPAVDSDIILRGKIPDYDFQTQHRIAAILSAYDDMIENNRRRIQLLEQAARLLYKEWFIRLRFPGHEHTKIVNGIPEGWEKRPLGELITLQRGFDLPVSKRKEGLFPIYASTGINGYHSEAKVKGPGVVTGRSGSLGTVMFVSGDFWPLNTTLWVKEFKLVGPHYANYLLANMQLEQYNGGAAVPTLNRNDVHRVEVLRPSSMLLRMFENQSHDIVKQVDALASMNLKLSHARDLLLPRLMNGEIAV